MECTMEHDNNALAVTIGGRPKEVPPYFNDGDWHTWRGVRGAPAAALVYWRRVEASVPASSASEVDSVTAMVASSWNTL